MARDELPYECFECGAPCDGDLCHDCEDTQLVAAEVPDEPIDEGTPDWWYDFWNEYVQGADDE